MFTALIVIIVVGNFNLGRRSLRSGRDKHYGLKRTDKLSGVRVIFYEKFLDRKRGFHRNDPLPASRSMYT